MINILLYCDQGGEALYIARSHNGVVKLVCLDASVELARNNPFIAGQPLDRLPDIDPIKGSDNVILCITSALVLAFS